MEWDNYSIIELFHLLKRDRLSFNDKDDQLIEVFRYLLSLSTGHRSKHLTFSSSTEPLGQSQPNLKASLRKRNSSLFK